MRAVVSQTVCDMMTVLAGRRVGGHFTIAGTHQHGKEVSGPFTDRSCKKPKEKFFKKRCYIIPAMAFLAMLAKNRIRETIMKRWTLCSVALVGLVAISYLWLKPSSSHSQGKKPDPRHDPANAVSNLEFHPELEATLFASEPAITNPTNLDIDHRGRVWLCDVVNYRGNNGKRPAGDRILILEDTDGDGKHDKVKVFYQGRDVDS